MSDINSFRRFMTQQGTADYCECSVRQIQILTKKGVLPVSYALGERSPRYDRVEIDRILAGQQIESPTEKAGGVRLAGVG